MAMNVDPQSGATRATSYTYDYQRHPQTITSVDYVVSTNQAVVTCYIKLQNGTLITGVHEQYHDKNVNHFKHLAYQQAIERAESLGFKLKA